MTRPEEALLAARRSAAEHGADYGHVDPIRVGPPYDQIASRLTQWAIVDPTDYEVRSIRRYGAPITWFKRLLVRLLYQFHAQLISDQSRYNVLLLSYVRTLEHRVNELEGMLRPEDPEEPDAFEDDWA
jgi:hypothetical protein